jgi:prepilin-type N-terminal cleavage/methylation domain-containing protein/prepilin-type processing-associated H-X9-DG protein
MSDRSICRKGFSLVELLVVMTVISLLAGLLLPVLEESLESARAIQCVGNLRQIGLAYESYVGDYGRIPSGTGLTRDGTAQGGSEYLGNYVFALAPYLEVNMGDPPDLCTPCEPGPLQCPEGPRGDTRGYGLTCYSHPVNLSPGGAWSPMEIDYPSKTFYLMDIVNASWSAISVVCADNGAGDYRHLDDTAGTYTNRNNDGKVLRAAGPWGGTANGLMFDGHVAL